MTRKTSYLMLSGHHDHVSKMFKKYAKKFAADVKVVIYLSVFILCSI